MEEHHFGKKEKNSSANKRRNNNEKGDIMKNIIFTLVVCGVFLSGCTSSNVSVNAQLPADQNIKILIETTIDKSE